MPYLQSINWDPIQITEDTQNLENLSCNAEFEIREDSVARVPKFTEGILVGGHVLVMIFSMCGNTAALIIVLKSKAPKPSTKYFLTWLAISDLLMTLTAPSTEVGKLMNVYNSWVFGSLLCILIPCFQLIAATMSAICLMAIAVERNLLIVCAMNVNSNTLSHHWEKWICPLICIAIIAVPVACGLPNIWGYEHVSFLPIPADVDPENITECNVRYHCLKSTFDHSNIIYYSVTGGTYFFLLGCFLICYISIYKFVQKHGNFKKEYERNNHSENRRFSTSTSTLTVLPPPPTPDPKLATAERHRKTLRLILWLILLHICCRLPNWIYLVVTNVIFPDIENIRDITQTMLTIRECLHLLSAINSALNPFLYVIWNHSLRATADRQPGRGARQGCCGWSRKRRNCHKMFHRFFKCCCKCCRCREWNVEEHNVEIFGHVPWKTPKIYYISDSVSKTANHPGIVPSVSTQRVCMSDKSLL